uniref:Alcohol dehydrogenase-like C-terminal domain-containing protein n=2 Tax=Chlamydomonas euryale TaxID=1486919 RepID=A0A7R9YS23_9CHLO|mmetsp:Transcript_14140/g.41058  ORF Transcript_14140/g.41058 Transcript_14140/m.41058 type:complete len:117 (+) Transcript_14140:374-724(+)
MKSVEGTFDLLINTVSSATDYKQQMQLLAKGGTLCLVGIPTEEIKGLTPADFVFDGKQLVGSVVGGRADMQEMLDMCAVTGIKAMCQTMPLSKVNEAIELLLANKPRYRIVLETDL